MSPDELKALIRDVADFPKPGILFRDITTLVSHGPGFAASVAHLADRAVAARAAAIAGIEARGFIFGAAVAARLALPFITVRKPGKLPVMTHGIDYALEYGSDRLEIDGGAVGDGQNVVLIDDLIATGGTAAAAVALLRSAGGHVASALFVIDLVDLGGAATLRAAGVDVSSLMDFPGH